MRINEILTESQLDEGPMLNKFGTAVGNVVGGAAKGVGAVAGGIAGIGSAFKKGFDRSKGIVGQGGDYVAPPDAPAPTAAPAAGAPTAGAAAPQPQGRVDPTMDEPAAEPASTTTPPSAAEINAQGPTGTAPAKAQTGDAGKALAKTTAVVDKQQAASQEKANQTVYAQVKANVDKLDKKGKQRILQLLQKSVAAPQPTAAPAAKAAAPAAGASTTPPATAAAPATGGAAAPANTMANTPVSATNTAAATNPNQPPPAKTGGKVAGQVSQTPGAVAKRGKRAAAKSASATGNKVMGNMVNQLSQQNAGKVNSGNALSEALAKRIVVHKQQIFETGLAQGTISVFKK